jgi:sugar (pentulose or hexulose) kinase
MNHDNQVRERRCALGKRPGTGARNAAWTGIRRRVLGVDVIPARCEEAAVGAAMLALQAMR